MDSPLVRGIKGVVVINVPFLFWPKERDQEQPPSPPFLRGNCSWRPFFKGERPISYEKESEKTGVKPKTGGREACIGSLHLGL